MTLALLSQAAGNPLLRYFYGDPGRGGMAPFQRRFHTSQADKRTDIAANKVGKTIEGGAESWCHLLGWHPFRKVPPPGSLGWLLCQDHTTGWPDVSHCLRELEPPGVVADGCHYIEGTGYLFRGGKALVLKNGSRLECKSGKQSLLAFEGARVQWGWINEPPDRPRFNALRARLHMDLGPLWATMTAVSRPCEWFRDIVEGNPDTGAPATELDWQVQHVGLTKENAPHRSQESIDKQIAECDPWERNQRILGGWEGVAAGRRLAAFNEALIFGDDAMPQELDELRLGFDWGEGNGKTMAHLVGLQGRRTYLVREFASEGKDGWTPRAYARGVLDMLADVGVSIHHIHRATGDTNSAGLLAAGVKYNRLMEDALAAELRLSRCPITIEPAMKRGGAPAASISAMNAEMREGRWMVHESCRRFIRSARYYTGLEKDLKDAIDSARYPVMDRLLQPRHVGSSPSLVI